MYPASRYTVMWCVVVLLLPSLLSGYGSHAVDAEHASIPQETPAQFWQNFTMGVYKRGIVSNASITFSSNTTPSARDPALFLGTKKLWEFNGTFGAYTNFTTPLTINFATNSTYTMGIELPVSRIEDASITLGANVSGMTYNIKLYAGDTEIWHRNQSSQMFVDGSVLGIAQNNLYAIEAGDLNSDGLIDIVASDRNGNLFGLKNLGNGTFEPFSVSVLNYLDHPAKKIMLRMNQNTALPDLFFQFYDCILCLRNNGNFTFSAPFSVSSPGAGITDFVVDATNLYVSKENGMVYVYNITDEGVNFWENYVLASTRINALLITENVLGCGADGKLYSSNGTNIPVGAFPLTAIALNSNASVVVGDANGSMYIITPDMSCVKVAQIPWQQICKILSCDVNADGKDDIVLTTLTNNLFVYTAGATFTQIFTGEGNYCTAMDMDGDSATDILTSSYMNRILLYRNNRNVFSERIKIEGALQSCIDASPVRYDAWGNRFAGVNFTMMCDAPINLHVSDLVVKYNYTQTIYITSSLVSYVDTAQPNETGFVNVPIIFESSQNFSISPVFALQYSSCPPYLVKLIPDLEFDEDSFPRTGIGLLNLSQFFGDEKDRNLRYRVAYMERPDCVYARVNGTCVDFYSAKDWYGRAMFRVAATDADGLETTSNFFNVTVQEVNDAPVLSLPSLVKINKNVDYWLNLSGCISDVDSVAFTITAESQYIQTYSENLSLCLNFPDEGNFSVNISVSDGIDTTVGVLNISVLPYGFPLWKDLPVIYTQKNKNISASTGIDLKDYVIDVDTPVQNLKFRVVSQTDRNINVSIVGTKIQVNLTYNYVGRNTARIAVNDSIYENYADLLVVVNQTNYPPVYLGGLNTTYLAYEDAPLIFELSKYFYDVEDGTALTYGCTSNTFTINGSLAVYKPEHGAHNFSAQFFAIDSAGQSAFSPVINFTYVEINDAPVYLGGLENATIFVNDTWSIDLDKYFWDEEGGLTYSASDARISIKNHTASFTANTPLSISFNLSATDGQYTAYSPQITITVILPNQKPTASIVQIKPEIAGPDTEIEFSGVGNDSDGEIVAWQWYSSIDGLLANNASFKKKLSIGEHIIRFRVQDNNGTWSDWAERIVIVKEHVAEKNPYIALMPGAGIGCIVVGFVLNLSGRLLMRWRRR